MGDFWRVNSYGYPNPFGDSNHQQAWETLLSFSQFRSYDKLKEYWASTEAPRRLKSSALESWKAAFEEYGLVHVPSSSDQVRLTAGGEQFITAGQKEDRAEWAWVGLNLLLRYPLRGPRQRRRGDHQDSDLLLYWFFYAAMRELKNYLWWPEITHVLCTVFNRADAEQAIERIRELRLNPELLKKYSTPVENEQGAFYNSINQVPNHASLGYFLAGKTATTNLYGTKKQERRHELSSKWLHLIDLALGGGTAEGDVDCDSSASFLQRMPKAPTFSDEEEYFEYAGAKVPEMPRPETAEGRKLRVHAFGQGTVVLLGKDRDYASSSGDTITGAIGTLCRLAKKQRVILEENMRWSYQVVDKEREGPDQIRVHLKRARPITDRAVIQRYLEEDDA